MKYRKIKREELLILLDYTLWRFNEVKKYPTLTLANVGNIVRRFENREKVMINKLNNKTLNKRLRQ